MRSLLHNRQLKILIASFIRFNKMQGSLFSAALAIQFFIAIIPIIIVGLAFLKINFTHMNIGYLLTHQLNLQGQTSQIVGLTFATVEDNYRLATTSSLLSLLIFSYGMVSTMQLTFARAWQIKSTRGWHRLLLKISWLAFFLITEFIEDFFVAGNPDQTVLTLVVATVCMFFLWLITPKLLVAATLNWKESLPTAIIGTACLIFLRIIEWYALPGLLYTYSEPFGAFGVAFSLLIWIWIVAYSWVWTAAYGAVYFEDMHD